MSPPSSNNAQQPDQNPLDALVPGRPATPPPGTPPMLPISPWGNDRFPRPEGDAADLAFHAPTFRQVARRLRADLATYRSAAEQLNKAGELQPSDMGQWAAAQDLYATAQRTHRSVAHVLEEFVASYTDLIHKLEHSAETYDSAEDATATAIRKLIDATTAEPADDQRDR